MIVYQAYNPISNRFYVGKTTQPLWVRRRRHAADAQRERSNSWFHKAIRKYGIDIFEWCVLAHASSPDELDRLERHWISLIKNAGHSVYNLRPGGTGGSEPGVNNHNYGRTIPKERRRKISQALREYYEGKPGTMTGMTGELAPFYGMSHGEEARRKISEANKGRPRPDIKGASNPSARRVFCETTSESFDTATEAAEKYQLDLSSIIKCCKGKSKSVKGMRFRYD